MHSSRGCQPVPCKSCSTRACLCGKLRHSQSACMSANFNPSSGLRGVCALLPPPVPRFPRCLSRIPRTRLPPAPRAARQRTRRPRRPRADCAPPACHHVRGVHCAVLMDPCSQGGRRHARPLLDEDGPAVLAAARGEQLGGSPGAWRLACPAAACFAVVAGHGQRGHDAQSPGACQPAVGGLDRH